MRSSNGNYLLESEMQIERNDPLLEMEYWMEVYERARLCQHDISFELFITKPNFYLEQVNDGTFMDCMRNGY